MRDTTCRLPSYSPRIIARYIALIVALILADGTIVHAGDKGREVIQDPQFRHGVYLEEPKPGKHVRYGELRMDADKQPAWALLQWSSRFPLNPEASLQSRGGTLTCSNVAKTIILSRRNQHGDVVLAANSGKEYADPGRKAGEPWVHLLVEQHFEPPQPLSNLEFARLHVEARLLKSEPTPGHNYDPDTHAAQFLIYFTLQNRNPRSAGYSDLLWFGIPVYDNRERYPKECKHLDFGGTAKYIFSPNGKTFTTQSAHDGEWITIDKDLSPLMREALEMAWERGFLKDSKTLSDYYIGGMNIGWELPGSFDVGVQVRDLSLKVKERAALPQKGGSP